MWPIRNRLDALLFRNFEYIFPLQAIVVNDQSYIYLSSQMIGSCTTYLIILVQFDAASKQNYRHCMQLMNVTMN